MPKCLIALGSNQEDPHAKLSEAIQFLDQEPAMRRLRTSSFYETHPVGGPSDQPNFLNGATLFETTLAPLALLGLLHDVENRLGRVRTETWGPRTIDLDLLLYDNEISNSPELTLPHPRMAWRRFVLQPAAEVAPEMIHPTTGWTIDQLLKHLDKTPRYVAFTGGIGAGKTRLLHHLSHRKEINLILETIDTPLLSCFYECPTSHARRVELEFLQQRTEQLQPQRLENASTYWTGSDFWFDQSITFARVWLNKEDYPSFFEQWAKAREKIVQPRLVVFLDPPMDRLVDQVVKRGRPFERSLDPTRLEQIHRSIAKELKKPDVGPVLRLSGNDPEKDLNELVAALDAME